MFKITDNPVIITKKFMIKKKGSGRVENGKCYLNYKLLVAVTKEGQLVQVS